jgi:hypothetical protein
MSTLSEVSILIGQNAADIEMARGVFTAETRRFVEGILEAIRRARSDPWTTARVRIDLPREIETESKTATYFSNQFAFARADLRFKKGTKFVVIAEIPFGIAFDEALNVFAWQVSLVPAARYARLDDALWSRWKAQASPPPGSTHQDKANTIRFASRPVSKELSAEVAFNDLKAVLEFVLASDQALAGTVGVDLTPGEEGAVVA